MWYKTLTKEREREREVNERVENGQRFWTRMTVQIVKWMVYLSLNLNCMTRARLPPLQFKGIPEQLDKKMLSLLVLENPSSTCAVRMQCMYRWNVAHWNQMAYNYSLPEPDYVQAKTSIFDRLLHWIHSFIDYFVCGVFVSG